MEEEKKELTLEQAKKYRFVVRVLFFLIAFVAPVLITGFKFQLFSHYDNYKLSTTGLLVLLIIAWRFKHKLVEWIKSWEDDNVFKWILIGIGRVWPFVLIVAIVGVIHWSATKILGDALFCLEWTCACELFSYIVLYPIEMKLDYKVKRAIRKKERVEDTKQAIKELREEEADG